MLLSLCAWPLKKSAPEARRFHFARQILIPSSSFISFSLSLFLLLFLIARLLYPLFCVLFPSSCPPPILSSVICIAYLHCDRYRCSVITFNFSSRPAGDPGVDTGVVAFVFLFLSFIFSSLSSWYLISFLPVVVVVVVSLSSILISRGLPVVSHGAQFNPSAPI